MATHEHNSLLRRFSVTDGLVRGTRLVSYVVFTAAFALLPGFGPHGLLFSNAIQFTFEGLLQTPFGWLADRFGWATAVIISFVLKICVDMMFLGAVLSAYFHNQSLAWLFVSLEAIVDSFAVSLQSGAYQAAYSRWYEIELKKQNLDLSQAPPLFIASGRFALVYRFGIPIFVILLVVLAQILPFGLQSVSAYTPTFFAVGVISCLRVIVLIRVILDLKEMFRKERHGAKSREPFNASEVFSSVKIAMSRQLPSFLMYAVSKAQYVISCFCIAGFAMKQINNLSFPQPYGWIASISLTLSIFILDTLFWRTAGHRIQKANAGRWICGLGILLLISCISASVVYWVNTHPLLQAGTFALCALAGVICSSAIERYLTSYLGDWADEKVMVTCLSFSEGIGMIGCGALLAIIIRIEQFVPSTSVILFISVMVAVSIIYYVNAGSLFLRRQ